MTAVVTSNQNGDTFTGTLGALADYLSFPSFGGIQAIGIQVSGAFVGTVVFDGSMDGGLTWPAVLNGYTSIGGTVGALSAAGYCVIPTGGFNAVRARCSAYTSGTININATVNGGLVPTSSAVSITGTATTALTFTSSNNTILQVASVIAPATPAGVLIKATFGRVFAIDVGNAGTTDVWLKLANITTAAVPGTTVMTTNIYCPKGQRTVYTAADLGDYYSSGITYYVSGGIGLTDATAITANMVSLNVRYY